MVTGPSSVAFLGLRDAFARQRSARQAGIEHRVALMLQPGPQPRHLRGTAHRIGAFDDDQLALQLLPIDARQRFAIEL